MILVIVRNEDRDAVLDALIKADFRVTYIASTGGFLRRGNTTLLIGTEAERVDQAMETIRNACSPAPDGLRRATVFVLELDNFTQL
ncbi:MAG: cyclic-di-AMP receptor [Anaerolineales bacterium]